MDAIPAPIRSKPAGQHGVELAEPSTDPFHFPNGFEENDMKRTLVVALLTLLFASSAVLADVITGKIEKVDAEKATLTVKTDGKSREFGVQKDALFFYKPVGKKKTGADVPDGLKGLKAGQEVTVWTESKAGKEVVTQVRVEQDGPVKKKKGK